MAAGMVIEEMDFGSVHFWIQVHNLPIEMITKKNAAIIGANLGRILLIEKPIAVGGLGRSFLRIQIEFDVNKPLICGFWVPRSNMDKGDIEDFGDIHEYGPHMRTSQARSVSWCSGLGKENRRRADSFGNWKSVLADKTEIQADMQHCLEKGNSSNVCIVDKGKRVFSGLKDNVNPRGLFQGEKPDGTNGDKIICSRSITDYGPVIDKRMIEFCKTTQFLYDDQVVESSVTDQLSREVLPAPDLDDGSPGPDL
ncbi:hypothetical protein COLO4_16655 [Corchorus olitorius]|uniref:DUF4283 domain-containing protein n=1 Tax=Corchorus olitorius TaxID=93759 RepID=A0A1R3JG61_9ROSI|nr:hypothetical protein COLO4_16655 [Corchorus olitorius]